MVIDLVIVTAPNPPGSRQLMMPGLAVLEIAPAKVLHGAVRLHGLTSSPTPETHVRVACALAKSTYTRESNTAAHMIDSNMTLRILKTSADRIHGSNGSLHRRILFAVPTQSKGCLS